MKRLMYGMAPGMGLEPMSLKGNDFRSRLRNRLDTPARVSVCPTDETGFNLTVT